MTPHEKQEVQRLLEEHARTVAVCRACAETARDLAWEVKRGSRPAAAALDRTIAEAERVLDDLGRMEMTIAEMKAAL